MGRREKIPFADHSDHEDDDDGGRLKGIKREESKNDLISLLHLRFFKGGGWYKTKPKENMSVTLLSDVSPFKKQALKNA